MDFFQHQELAHRRTRRLVFYFLLAVLGIVASVYLACLLIFGPGWESLATGFRLRSFWRPDLLGYSAAGTLAVIAGGCLYKISELSTGGGVVAESLGGRLLKPNSTDLQERKLLNVVEEMSIASGVPMPKVYVLDDERGINAFASGFSSNDAAVAVTRGCMERLNRDELQGVIGHEFSHILNGDMRLNIRLMGLIFGLICLAVIGRILLRTRGRKNPLPLLGLALIIVSGFGVFFGRMIQAAVSRQREFLADASAVQFTRNPAGLSRALQKIGAVGSQLQTERAEEASHMYFSNGLRSSFLGMFATHPPLADRIRAIDPSWQGDFPAARGTASAAAATSSSPESGLISPLASAPSAPPVVVGASGLSSQSAIQNMGQPTLAQLRYAEQLRTTIPAPIQTAAREPLGATALIFALLLSDQNELRATQLAEIARRMSPDVSSEMTALAALVAGLPTKARLPLVNLAVAALREMSGEEFETFHATLRWLIESDGQIDLFEYVLEKILERNLTRHFHPGKPLVVQYYALPPLLPDLAVLFSALAHVGSSDAQATARAFRAGAAVIPAGGSGLTLLPSAQCGLAEIDRALNRLAATTPQIKKQLIAGSVQVVGADGVVQEREAELLRGIAETLDCPMPPLV